MKTRQSEKVTRIAVDVESAYSDDCSLKKLDSLTYSRDSRSAPLLVSLATADGKTLVLDPENFGSLAEELAGAEIVHHNASFDETYLQMKARSNELPGFTPARVYCSADLASYLQYPRTLAGACNAVFGESVSKEIRDRSKNMSLEELKASEFWDDFKDYAGRDSELALKLFNELESQWPDHERRLSEHTRLMLHRGIGIDRSALDESIEMAQNAVVDSEKRIPWCASGAAPGSVKELEKYCLAAGIDYPSSTAKENEGLVKWLGKYPDHAFVVQAMQDRRSANALLKKLQTLRARVDDRGRVPVQLKYAGAHTLRWSGSGGFNFQNLPRGKTFGVDLRGLFQPAPGHKFVICDLSQIEPRVQYWLAEDEKMLDRLRNGEPLYEAHARSTMGWTGGILKNENPELYQMAKARVLGLGYKLQKPETLVDLARKMAGLDLSILRASQIIKEYAAQNPRIVQMWEECEMEMAKQVATGKFVWGLQSGRELIYHNFRRAWRDGQYFHGFDKRERANVQILCENLVQCTARDVFAEMILAIEDAGLPVVLHVHDEVVIEVKDNEAEQALETVEKIMSTAPVWAEGLPVAAEGIISERYTK